MKIFINIKTEYLLEQFIHCFKKTSHRVVFEMDDAVMFSIIEGDPQKTSCNTLWITEEKNTLFNTIQLPFSVMDVISRISELPEVQTTNNGMIIDSRSRQVTVGDRVINLSSKEFSVLSMIKSLNGDIIDRTTLLEEIWGMNSKTEPRAVDVTVARLRSKLGFDYAAHIQTVSGAGYRWKNLS